MPNRLTQAHLYGLGNKVPCVARENLMCIHFPSIAWVTLAKSIHEGSLETAWEGTTKAVERGREITCSHFYNQAQVFSLFHSSCFLLTESPPPPIYNDWPELHSLNRNLSNMLVEYPEISVWFVNKVLSCVRGWMKCDWSACFQHRKDTPALELSHKFNSKFIFHGVIA